VMLGSDSDIKSCLTLVLKAWEKLINFKT